MKFRFTVDCEVQRIEGLFASRDELSEQFIEALEQAAPDELPGDNGGQYEVVSWEVGEEPPPGRRR